MKRMIRMYVSYTPLFVAFLESKRIVHYIFLITFYDSVFKKSLF